MMRYPKKYLIYRLVFSPLYSLLLAFGVLVEALDSEGGITWMEGLIFFLLIYVVVQVVVIIAHTLTYRFTTYELKESEIVFKKGWIFKKRTVVLYEKIHAMNQNQTLFQKIFKLRKLAIDSGSTLNAAKEEIVIYEDQDKIDELENKIRRLIKKEPLLEQGNEMEEASGFQKELIYQYKTTSKFQKIALFILSLLFYSILTILAAGVIMLLSINNYHVLVFGLLLVIVLAFFVALFGTVVELLNMYDYRVEIQEENLYISYGLLSRVKHILPLKKIKAIRVEEGFFKRIFKLASIKIEVIGYSGLGQNNEGNGQMRNEYIPLCRKSQVNEYIALLNPSLKYEDKEYTSPKRAYRFFISLPIYIFTFIYLIGLSLLPIVINEENGLKIFMIIYVGVYLFMIGMIVLHASFRHKYAGLHIGENQMTLHYGGLYKKALIIPNKNITEIKEVDTYCRRRKKIATYQIHYFNDAIKNTQEVHLIESGLLDTLLAKVRF